jgi:hypothetical protein
MNDIEIAAITLNNSVNTSEFLLNRYMMNPNISANELFTLVADIIYSLEDTIICEYNRLRLLFESGYFKERFSADIPNTIIQRVYKNIGNINYMMVVARRIENDYISKLPYNPKMSKALVVYEMHTAYKHFIKARDDSVKIIHKIQAIIRNILLN